MKWYRYDVVLYKQSSYGEQGEVLTSFEATSVEVQGQLVIAHGDGEVAPDINVISLGANQVVRRGRCTATETKNVRLSERYCSECGQKKPYRRPE